MFDLRVIDVRPVSIQERVRLVAVQSELVPENPLEDRIPDAVREAKRGREAFKALYNTFEPVMRRIAGKYRGVSFEDAFQEACLALWNCVLEYDAGRDIPFEPYAITKIRGDVRTAMRRLWRHDDRRYTPSAKQVDEFDGNVFDSLGFESTEGITEYAFVDTVASFESARLSPREQLSIEAFLVGKSNKELAVECGVSHESVKTWRKRALRKLQMVLASDVM